MRLLLTTLVVFGAVLSTRAYAVETPKFVCLAGRYECDFIRDDLKRLDTCFCETGFEQLIRGVIVQGDEFDDLTFDCIYKLPAHGQDVAQIGFAELPGHPQAACTTG